MKRVTQVKRVRRHIRFACLACLACLAFLAGEASAMQPPHKAKQEQVETSPPTPVETPEAKSEEKKGEEGESMHEALDRRYRFAKRFQSEFDAFGGDYLGDEWYNTWQVGGRYYFHINNTFAVGAEYFYSPLRVDSSGDFGKSISSKTTHTINGQVMISNDAAFRSGKSVIECDLFLTLGGGSIQIDRKWQYLIEIGGGIKVYMPVPWIAVRFDVESYLHPTPKPTGNAFNADLAINAGVAFLFPVRKADQSKETSSN